MRPIRLVLFWAALISCVFGTRASAQSLTSFIYQGKVERDGAPYTGNADVRFRLFDSLAGGSQIGSTVTAAPVAVDTGVFSTRLDFADAIVGLPAPAWLEVSVRTPSGSGAFVTLSPRQPVESAPFAANARGIQVDLQNNVYLSGTLNLATSGLKFSDGTTLSTALDIPTTPGVKLVQSSTSSVTLNHESCHLYSPLVISCEVITIPTGGGGYTTQRGNAAPIEVDVSRPAGVDETWRTHWESTVASGFAPANLQTLHIVQSRQSGGDASLDIPMLVAGYRVETTGTQVLEILHLIAPTRTMVAPVLSGQGGPIGILTGPTILTMKSSGITAPGARVVRLDRPAEVSESGAPTIQFQLEGAPTPIVIVRNALGSSPTLLAWFSATAANTVTPKDFDVASGTVTLFHSANAWPFEYRIVQSATEELYEEYSIVSPRER